jgi:hypothetical protein
MTPENRRDIPNTIAQIEKIIDLKTQQVRLLLELRRNLRIAMAAGVDPDAVATCGYDRGTDPRWRKQKHGQPDPKPAPNYVILKDGRRVDFAPVESDAQPLKFDTPDPQSGGLR